MAIIGHGTKEWLNTVEDRSVLICEKDLCRHNYYPGNGFHVL